MIFIGDYFAFVIVLLLCLFFFDKQQTISKTSRYFIGFLLMTGATAIIDVITGIMNYPVIPMWISYTVNSLYFIVNILSTSSIALYLFNKILEHSHDKHCLKYAKCGLSACLAVYLFFVIANIRTGWLFYFDENTAYCRGPLNALGYGITMIQMMLVGICYFRNRKNANKAIRRILISTFPVAVLFIVVQRVYPEIMMNSFAMSLVAMILFATYNAQRPGVHALTRLNDRHRFFDALEAYISSGKSFHIFTINIKNFGLINQKHGHMFGDELLYQFAFSLEKLLKTGEAFHMNGTVFALILPGSEDKPAGKLRSALPVLDHKSITRHRAALMDFLSSGITCENQHPHCIFAQKRAFFY